MKNQELYYATKEDLESSMQRIEEAIALEYCETGSREEPNFKRFSTYKEIPNFGVSLDGKRESSPYFLVYEKGNEVVPEIVPQKRGGERHIISATHIPEFAIYLQFSSAYQNECLIYGTIYRTNETLYKLIQKHFFKGYKKVKAFKVGPQALELLNQGFPLTPNLNADPTMYLKC